MRHGEATSVVQLMGMSLARVREHHVLDRVFSDLSAGKGGWIVTVNLDMLRRHHHDGAARALYAEADLRIADGMPLVWASRLMGARALPERVAGSCLARHLAERAALERRSLCLLGGAPGAARAARRALSQRYPGLRVVEAGSPTLPLQPTDDGVARLVERIAPMAPDILLVGLGSPKQEYWIRALRPHLPRTWMIGVGVTFSFLGGQIRRAPRWMQRSGLEWVHRLAQEPRRLARRYLIEDLPFAWTLLQQAARQRLRARP
jgi:N-acetylglucosaminyldiphosphoundecaprenol N-acetyl-beta-D-mannosaminyltransferase